MPKLQQMTTREYVTIKALKYPILWASDSYEFSKLIVLDHLLSVLGNGITFDTLLADSKKSKKNQEELKLNPDNLFNGSEFYYVHKKGTPSYETLKHPITGKDADCLTLAEIQELGWDNDDYSYYPNGKRSVDKWRPYPNFTKQYSLLWENQADLHLLPQDFLKEFINYYEETYKFFSSDRKYLHFYACPRPNDEELWKTKLKEWEEIFERATHKIPEDEKNAHFSKAYGFPFTGDMKQFLIDRFNNEVENNISFIYETIVMLESVIKFQDEQEAIKQFNQQQLKKLKKMEQWKTIMTEKPDWKNAPDFAQSLALKVIEGEDFGKWCWLAANNNLQTWGFVQKEGKPN